MCTAITYKNYFGRTLDLDCSFRECVTVTPRAFPFPFRHLPPMPTHYAIIGMAAVENGYPLYYEATNEHGLSMAGLHFPDNAHYFPLCDTLDNVAPFEFIPHILGQCKNLAEARALLARINLCDTQFSAAFPLSPLHWILADKTGAVTVETVADGLKLYENPVGVLTNNPPFDYHMTHLAAYMQLTHQPPENRFAKDVPLVTYSRGMGAIGLPGDLSSTSRFIRAAFVQQNSLSEGDGDLIQFFHILGAVDQQRGCVRLENDAYEITVYTSACDMENGVFYYTTYENSRITAVDMHKEDLDGSTLVCYPLRKQTDVLWEKQTTV